MLRSIDFCEYVIFVLFFPLQGIVVLWRQIIDICKVYLSHRRRRRRSCCLLFSGFQWFGRLRRRRVGRPCPRWIVWDSDIAAAGRRLGPSPWGCPRLLKDPGRRKRQQQTGDKNKVKEKKRWPYIPGTIFYFLFFFSSFPSSISIWTSFVSSCRFLVGSIILSPRFRFLLRLV